MSNEYIRTEQFTSLITDLYQKLGNGDITACKNLLNQVLMDIQTNEVYIDRTYIGNLKEKKRNTRMADINRMLSDMSLEQIDNVFKYTADEYDEPNHEAEALEAIIQLSRRGKPEKV